MYDLTIINTIFYESSKNCGLHDGFHTGIYMYCTFKLYKVMYFVSCLGFFAKRKKKHSHIPQDKHTRA